MGFMKWLDKTLFPPAVPIKPRSLREIAEATEMTTEEILQAITLMSMGQSQAQKAQAQALQDMGAKIDSSMEKFEEFEPFDASGEEAVQE